MITLKQRPGKLDIEISSLDDVDFVVTFKYKSTGIPINLTGYTFESYIEWSNGSQKINSAIYGSVSNGQVQIELTKGQLAKVPKTGNKTWYLKWTANDKSRKVLEGALII